MFLSLSLEKKKKLCLIDNYYLLMGCTKGGMSKAFFQEESGDLEREWN